MNTFELQVRFEFTKDFQTVAISRWKAPSGSPRWLPPLYAGYRRVGVSFKEETDAVEHWEVRDEESAK
jgi:hypothetical protein